MLRGGRRAAGGATVCCGWTVKGVRKRVAADPQGRAECGAGTAWAPGGRAPPCQDALRALCALCRAAVARARRAGVAGPAQGCAAAAGSGVTCGATHLWQRGAPEGVRAVPAQGGQWRWRWQGVAQWWESEARSGLAGAATRAQLERGVGARGRDWGVGRISFWSSLACCEQQAPSCLHLPSGGMRACRAPSLQKELPAHAGTSSVAMP